MSLKQLFYAAFTARIISWLSLAVFFFCLFTDLELKTAVLALGVSHLAWMLGTMFLGVFRESMAEQLAGEFHNMVNKVVEPEEQELADGLSHPIFDDEETND